MKQRKAIQYHLWQEIILIHSFYETEKELKNIMKRWKKWIVFESVSITNCITDVIGEIWIL